MVPRGTYLSNIEDRGMVIGGALVSKMQAWFHREHERYDFSIASECFHQCQRVILLINWVGCH